MSNMKRITNTKTMAKKLISILLTVCMLFTFTISFVNAEDTNVDPTGMKYNGYEVYTGTFENQNAGVQGDYYYSDGYFMDATTKYNEHLATLSMCAAVAAISTKNPPVKSMLTDLGFTNIDDQFVTPTADSIGAVLAQKTLNKGFPEECVLIPIVLRGDYQLEWCSNFTVGTSGDSAGFLSAANQIVQMVGNYISNNSLGEKNIKLWITGYSRGGAVTDVAGKLLSDTYGAENVYAYAFEAPAAAQVDQEGTYPNIHCVSNYNDFVPFLVPEYMGFKHYGVTHYFANDSDNAKFSDQETKMLKLMKEFGDRTDYVSPTTFTWSKLLFNVSSSPITIVKDETHIEGRSARDFAKTVMERLEDTIWPTRASYASDDLPQKIKDAWTAMGVSAYSTYQEAIVAAVRVLASQDTSVRVFIPTFADNFKNITEVIQAGFAKGPIYEITSLTYLNQMISYSNMSHFTDNVQYLWTKLNTDGENFKSLSHYFTKEQIAELKRAFPVVVYIAVKYFKEDREHIKQTVGSLLVNSDLLLQCHYADVSCFWIMSEDSYYSMAKISLSANGTDKIDDFVVDTVGSECNAETVIRNYKSTDEVEYLLAETEDVSLEIYAPEATDSVPKVVNIGGKTLKLYKDQTAVVTNENGDAVVTKKITVNSPTAEYTLSKDGTKITFTGESPKNYCYSTWKVNGKTVSEKKARYVYSIGLDSENITVDYSYATHKMKAVKKAAGYCSDGYTCNQCTVCGHKENVKTIAGTKPAKLTIKKVTAAKKALTVSWKAAKKKITGYQIQYSTKSNFKGAKTVKVSKKATSKKITKLSAKKKYYVKVRAYHKNGAKTYYSDWSKVKTVTTKK